MIEGYILVSLGELEALRLGLWSELMRHRKLSLAHHVCRDLFGLYMGLFWVHMYKNDEAMCDTAPVIQRLQVARATLSSALDYFARQRYPEDWCNKIRTWIDRLHRMQSNLFLDESQPPPPPTAHTSI